MTLDVPGPKAPFAERSAAYQALRPARYHETDILNGPFAGNYVSRIRQMDYLQLANGTRVYYPEDLLTAVPPDSESARAIARSKSWQRTQAWLGVAALGCLLAGGTMVALSGVGGEHVDSTLLYAGVGVGLGGAIGFGFGTQAAQTKSSEEVERAYLSFDDDLQRTLQVCVEPNCKPGALQTPVQPR